MNLQEQIEYDELKAQKEAEVGSKLFKVLKWIFFIWVGLIVAGFIFI